MDRGAEGVANGSEGRFQTLVDNVRDYAIFMLDADGVVTEWTEGAQRVKGYAAEEVIGRHLSMFFTPEEIAAGEPDRELAEAAEEGRAERESWRVRKDGERIWVNEIATAVRDDEGRLLGFTKISRDLTERRRTEEALRESEERLQRAIAIETVGVIFFKPDGQITEANDAFLRMSGYSREDLAEGLLRWDVMTPPEWMPHSLRAVEELQTTGRTTPYEKEYIRKDGSRWWGLFAATRLGEDESVEFIIDVTARKLAEEALRNSEEQLQLAIDAAQLGRWELVPETGEFFTSAICNRHLGLSAEAQPTHEGHFENIHPDDHKMIYRRLSQALEESGEFEVEYRTLHPGGVVRWIMSRARVVDGRDSASARLIGVTLDVTGHREAEEERARLQGLELAARAEAMERKRINRELHDRVAHSMGVVHQSLELYEAYVKKDPALAAEKLQLAKESTRRALDQTRNLSSELDRSHVEDTREGVVAAVRALLKTHVPPGVETKLSAPDDESSVPTFVGEQVYLVMREAVRNAVTHSGCGRIRVILEVQEGELYGLVEDDGAGFDPDGKLTPGRFGEDSSHSGVGLRSMRERAELLGGEVVVSSEPGRGTRVEVRVSLE